MSKFQYVHSWASSVEDQIHSVMTEYICRMIPLPGPPLQRRDFLGTFLSIQVRKNLSLQDKLRFFAPTRSMLPTFWLGACKLQDVTLLHCRRTLLIFVNPASRHYFYQKTTAEDQCCSFTVVFLMRHVTFCKWNSRWTRWQNYGIFDVSSYSWYLHWCLCWSLTMTWKSFFS